MRMRAADWQWLAEWKAWKDCVCLSLNEVLVFVLVLVLDVLQEMDPGVLLQRSGKVLVREKKKEHRFHVSFLGNFIPSFHCVNRVGMRF